MSDYEVLTNSKNIAVIGMNADPQKFANKIYKKLKENNKTVYGINPNYTEIDGEKIYSSIATLDEDVDMVVMVVAPRHGINMLEDIKAKGVKILWLQPGTINDELLEKAQSLDLTVIQNCVLKEYQINQ